MFFKAYRTDTCDLVGIQADGCRIAVDIPQPVGSFVEGNLLDKGIDHDENYAQIPTFLSSVSTQQIILN